MCGIVGYVGKGLAIPIVLDSLKRLEYRGYDSAGVAFCEGQSVFRERRAGKLIVLSEALKNRMISSGCAIGHTRWATHGAPNVYNAHPQNDTSSNIFVVHNGIIENFAELRDDLIDKGVVFSSQTDTEVIAQLLAIELLGKIHTYQNVVRAISTVIKKLRGSFALAILVKGLDYIFAVKRSSPLIVGEKNGECFLASDIPAILPYTDRILHIKDDEIVVLCTGKIRVYDNNLKQRKLLFRKVNTKMQEIMLGSFESFMQKEIFEGAKATIDTVERLQHFDVCSQLDKTRFDGDFDLHIAACGTALHAGRIAKLLIEKYLRLPVDIDYASEFRYSYPILSDKSICIFISQSGETADTLACLDLAKSLGAYTIGITNVASSKLAGEVDVNIPTSAGVELAVASTKAYLAQLGAIYCLVVSIAKLLHKSLDLDINVLLEIVRQNGDMTYCRDWETLLPDLSELDSLFFVGRGVDYYLAMEGALKVKEISYIHCEAMPAGELKHGSLALITPQSYVVVLLTQAELMEKTINAIHEMQSRGAKIILITTKDVQIDVTHIIKLPAVPDAYSPFIAIRPMQELAYMLAKHNGYDPDKPRNLAKSVTVE